MWTGPVLGHVERDRDQPREEDRQRAVDEEAVALVVRIERRRLGVEVLPHRLRQCERAGDHGEEALVGVQVLLVEPDRAAGLDFGRRVPVQPTEAQPRRDRQHEQESELPVEEATPAGLWSRLGHHASAGRAVHRSGTRASTHRLSVVRFSGSFMVLRRSNSSKSRSPTLTGFQALPRRPSRL